MNAVNTQRNEISVLTMNCLGLPVPVPGLRRRLVALGAAIAALGVDVACLQEVGRWRHLPLLRHDDTEWPYLTSFAHPYAPKGGLVTLSRLPILSNAYHTYKERGTSTSLHMTERYQAKGVQTTVLQADPPLIVLNTHLAANYTARWSYTNSYAKVERAQLRELAEVVRAIPDDALVIIAGDFNVPRNSWLYDEFRSATGVIDPLVDATEPTYRPGPGVPTRAAQALDHIFVRAPRHFELTMHAELCLGDPVWLAHGTRGYLSDHLGIRLHLQWQAQPFP
jgi:endonuclease/exonuclease/phosphatase family metal-dependent hydrolase